MFKKLDKLITRAFAGPFIATFFVTLLVLTLQFFWLYIDDFVGKGLGIDIILEFIWYQSATLVPLALPLSVLLASLMTFGNLGESSELIAIKSSGISLLRFMRPVFIITFFICGIAFTFSNYIIPVANLKSRTLLADIIMAKPSFDLREGVFYDKISGFAIKIGKKEKNDSVIRDVIIFEQGNPSQDNFITAKKGVMRVSENKRFLEFNLEEGWRYQEKQDNNAVINSQFVRIHFREFRKQFDLSSFQFNRTADSLNRNNEKMLSMRQLSRVIDSLETYNRELIRREDQDQFFSFQFSKYLDSNWHHSKGDKIPVPADFDALLPDSAKSIVWERAFSQVNNMQSRLEVSRLTLREKEKTLISHKIEWHRKISLSLACLVLFLVGAPLGSIIKRGGFGAPMVFAIFFFMVFYFSGTTGEKMARESSLPVFTGMWQSTFILLSLGLFLTYKAMHDSRLLNKEFYYRMKKKISKYIRRHKG